MRRTTHDELKKPVDDTLESDSGDQQKIITRMQATETGVMSTK